MIKSFQDLKNKQANNPPPSTQNKSKKHWKEQNQVKKNKILTLTYFPEGTKKKDQEWVWQS